MDKEGSLKDLLKILDTDAVSLGSVISYVKRDDLDTRWSFVLDRDLTEIMLEHIRDKPILFTYMGEPGQGMTWHSIKLDEPPIPENE